jgi:hypothetical protein
MALKYREFCTGKAHSYRQKQPASKVLYFLGGTNRTSAPLASETYGSWGPGSLMQFLALNLGPRSHTGTYVGSVIVLYRYHIYFQALFTNELEGGNRQKAMKRLRVPPLTEQVSYISSLISLC